MVKITIPEFKMIMEAEGETYELNIGSPEKVYDTKINHTGSSKNESNGVVPKFDIKPTSKEREQAMCPHKYINGNPALRFISEDDEFVKGRCNICDAKVTKKRYTNEEETKFLKDVHQQASLYTHRTKEGKPALDENGTCYYCKSTLPLREYSEEEIYRVVKFVNNLKQHIDLEDNLDFEKFLKNEVLEFIEEQGAGKVVASVKRPELLTGYIDLSKWIKSIYELNKAIERSNIKGSADEKKKYVYDSLINGINLAISEGYICKEYVFDIARNCNIYNDSIVLSTIGDNSIKKGFKLTIYDEGNSIEFKQK